MRFILSCLIFFAIVSANAAGPDAYVIYDKDGNKTEYSAMATAAAEVRVVLFGELHNNPIAHWLQYEMLLSLYKIHGKDLALGAEMFETDNQLVVDEYIKGLIPEKNFEKEAKLWSNYKTDYRPLLRFARDSGLAFAATNIPRRYAAMVARKGMQSLGKTTEQALELGADPDIKVDYELSSYKKMAGMMGGMHRSPMGHKKDSSASEKTRYFIQAQALKDATMARTILRYLEDYDVMLHFHGAFHSDDYQGIMWYLLDEEEDLEIMTISTVEQEDCGSLNENNKGKADFIIVVPQSMTKTH